MKSINILVLFLLTSNGLVFSQPNPLQLSITPTYGVKTLHLMDSIFATKDSNDLQIKVLKFYISNIHFLQNGKVVLQNKNSFYLVDAASEKPLQIAIDNIENVAYDELKFNLGIDSVTSVSGVLGGDLDPTRGMYWTWQSGYINVKLEGKSVVCNTRNKEFIFHLGGYQQPLCALQQVSFAVIHTEQIKLNLDVQRILSQIDLANHNLIMSPSAEGVQLSKVIAHAFTISKN